MRSYLQARGGGELHPAGRDDSPTRRREGTETGNPDGGTAFDSSVGGPCRKLWASVLANTWARRATTPVQPVWCEAPIPAPLSPWKYSWNRMLSPHGGSSWNRLVAPNTGRSPFSFRVNVEISRRLSSAATSYRFISLPEPVGHSIRKSSP